VKRTIAWVVTIAIVVIGSLGLRTVLEGRAALAEGDAALADKRPADAIAAYETAARWYFPAAPHVDEAYDRLRQLANQRSLAAWRSIRAAARATKTLWQPHADDLAAADAAIVVAAADDPERAPIGGSRDKVVAWQTLQLARDPRPGTGSAALAVVGLVAWLVGMALVIRRPKALYAAISAGGLAVWALGLYTA
jgi:hypothetical protein